MAKLRIQKHKAVHPKFIDEGLIRVADDLVKSILNACWTWNGKPNLHAPTSHMKSAMWAYEDYKQEIKG